MADKKIIVVFGATGQQGGSVVDFLLEDGTFAVRGVTRSVDSDKAKALTARGVQMVAANVADAASFAKGKGVFDDAYGAFIITNFWDPSSMGKELEQGVALVDAAEACGVKALQYGSLVDVEKISGGKLDVPHFTHKAKVEQYVLEKKNFEFTAFPAAAFYFSNMLTFFPPKVDDNGVSVFTLPNTRTITGFDVSDIGGVSLAIFKNPAKYNKLFVPCAGEHFTPAEFVAKFEKHTGKKVSCVSIDCHREENRR
eukprot:TRINITY_DN386_c0_g1_i4.p1 TRINITY_DN386_c0_g1~~TRINITY_DN386_c0_g1_i4.p1  ORF type:complete len:278 (-),score=134.81 TRINITY_DN386_c0_g1_i4:275-1036(-)